MLVKTVRCSVSENNCRHPFWPCFNVSIICTLCIDVRGTNRLLVELGHMPEYNLATAHWMASHPSVHSGLLHTYPDIIESTTISLRIQKFPRPHLSGFIVVPRTPLGILATEHASERRVRAELRAREKTWERGYTILNTVFMAKNWVGSCYVIGKKYRDLAFTRFHIHSVFKNSNLKSVIVPLWSSQSQKSACN